jgi:hypothetical protein
MIKLSTESKKLDLFAQKSFNLIVNDLNCSVYSKNISIFEPELLTAEHNDFNFELSSDLNNEMSENSPFKFNLNGSTLTLTFRIAHLNISTLNFNMIDQVYKLKITAIAKNSSLIDEMILNVQIKSVPPESECLIINDHDKNNQIKILFADSLFSDFFR